MSAPSTVPVSGRMVVEPEIPIPPSFLSQVGEPTPPLLVRRPSQKHLPYDAELAIAFLSRLAPSFSEGQRYERMHTELLGCTDDIAGLAGDLVADAAERLLAVRRQIQELKPQPEPSDDPALRERLALLEERVRQLDHDKQQRRAAFEQHYRQVLQCQSALESVIQFFEAYQAFCQRQDEIRAQEAAIATDTESRPTTREPLGIAFARPATLTG